MNQGVEAFVKMAGLTAAFLLIIAWKQGIYQTPTAPQPPIVSPLPSPPRPKPITPPEPGSNIAWIAYGPKKTTTNPQWGSVLTDIEQHLNPKHGSYYSSSDNITHGHETTHGINSDIRNSLGGKGRNGFYCLEGRAFVLTEPNLRIHDVSPIIPQSIRGFRYNLYMIQQARQWDDSPTYIFDEWIAYINGTTVGIDQAKNGILRARTGLSENGGTEIVVTLNANSDDAIAPMEFAYYSLCVCYAAKQKDPGYFERHPEFMEFVAFNIRRSWSCYSEAIKMPQFQWDTKLIDSFRDNAETAALRQFAVDSWGQEFSTKYLLCR